MRLGRIVHGDSEVYCDIADDICYLLEGAEPESATRTGAAVALADAIFLPPVQPTKVLAVLGAFLRGRPPAEARERPPGFTSKLVSCINPHGRPVIAPFDAGTTLDGEAELGVVLSRDCRRVTPEQAREAILGFTCVNDVTLTDRGATDKDFMRAKSVDTFGCIGPWIDTDLSPDDVTAGLDIRGFINGEQTQYGNTREYTYNVLETISWASQFFSLRRFDLICLGTPTPVSRLAVGDEMTVTVEKVGTLINHVVLEQEMV